MITLFQFLWWEECDERNVYGITFWQQHLEGWRKSGLTQQQYCGQHDLKFTTFARYRNRINRAGKAEPSVPAGFVPVVVKAEPSMGVSKRLGPQREALTTASTMEIRLCNGRSIALAADSMRRISVV